MRANVPEGVKLPIDAANDGEIPREFLCYVLNKRTSQPSTPAIARGARRFEAQTNHSITQQ